MQFVRTFAYHGFNRCSALPVIEQFIAIPDSDLAQMGDDDARVPIRLERALAILLADRGGVPQAAAPRGEVGGELLARCSAWAAIALQNAAGHQVTEVGPSRRDAGGCYRVHYEFEEPDIGCAAGELGRDLVQALLDGLAAQPASRPLAPAVMTALAARVQAFIARAESLAMPVDAVALVKAARGRDIPVLRMDRPPYAPLRGGFRVRENALLRLGHGHEQHTVDGNFCVDLSESCHGLIRDRRRLLQRLQALDLPTPGGRRPPRFCATPGRAARVARRLGVAVAVRAGTRCDDAAAALGLSGDSMVAAAAERLLASAEQVLVEPFVEGVAYRLVVAGGEPLALLEQTGRGRPEDAQRLAPVSMPAHLRVLARRVATEFPVGLLVVTVVSPDLSRPLEACGGAVVGVDLAPRLDRLFAADDPALRSAAEAFVDWMFPPPANGRIPIVAITGTNGKTTTTRLVARVMSEAGFAAGMACSDGSRVLDEALSEEEDGHLIGHLKVLDDARVAVAVLESTRGGAATAGLGFDRCRAATCLNVTADHLDDHVGIRSVEAMAELKRWIVARSEDVVVLNADDRHCLAMTPHLDGRRIGLVSLTSAATSLWGNCGAHGAVCVLESCAGECWIVIHDGAARLPLVAVSSVPLTYGGQARHNVVNVMHAALLCHMLGVGRDAIVRALSTFEPDFETLPGRLNIHRGPSFDVIMDYAHNPAGVRMLGAFVQRLPVTGRRLLALSCAGYNGDAFIRETAAAAAGSFDHYVCKNFGNLFGREPEESPALLREGLVAAGVDRSAVTGIEDEMEAVDAVLAMAEPGDLVVIVAGKRKRAIWERIVASGADTAAGVPE